MYVEWNSKADYLFEIIIQNTRYSIYTDMYCQHGYFKVSSFQLEGELSTK